MSNISVAEILKIHGKWIQSTPFIKFVADKKRITERYAYILIKKAVENHDILRLLLENRTVLYGLTEFGPPQTTSKKQNDESLRLVREAMKYLG